MLLGKQKFFDPVMANTKEKYCEIKKSTSNVQRVSGLLIIRFEEGLFFGNVGQLTDKLKRIEMHGELGVHPGEDPRSFFVWDDETQVFEPNSVIKGVIFDMKAVSEMDAT